MKKITFFLLTIGLAIWINLNMFVKEISIEPTYSANLDVTVEKNDDVTPQAIKEIGDFAETYARPLFSITRRPYVQIVEVKEAVAAVQPIENLPKSLEVKKVEKPQLLVKGITAGPRGAKALLENRQTNKTNWVSVDELIGGWRVTRIDQGKITLNHGKQHVTIELYPSVKSKVRSDR